MKFRLPLVVLSCFILGGCNSMSSDAVISSEEDSSEISYNFEQIVEIPEINIEVGQKLYIDSYINTLENPEIICPNDIISYSDEYLTGNKEGDTYFVLKVGEKYQQVIVHVAPTGTYESAWNYSDLETTGAGKKVVCFGDSVSAEETYSNAGITYNSLICDKYGMSFTNYAIGGTTGTFMFEGSMIMNEYRGTQYYDGVTRCKMAYDAGELNDADIAVIAFGHNDQYFQPPLEAEGEDYDDIENYGKCKSFKGSYRFMIKLLRKANPNIKIVLLNCTYSEYYNGRYKKVLPEQLFYADYRRAIAEVAAETDCKHIDPWEYMKPYFMGEIKGTYYHDSVHINGLGHKMLFKYIIKH